MPGLSECWGSRKIRFFLPCTVSGDSNLSQVAGWSMATASRKAPVTV